VPGFEKVDDHALLELVGDSANLFWREGSIVFRRGAPSDGIYVVLSGAVRIFGDDGEEVNVLGAGEFFGEFSLVLGTNRLNDVAAAEDSELMVVPKETFDRLINSSPELGAEVRRKLEERLPDKLRSELSL
jgi:potassium-dependent mechanosensitive channel